MIQLNKNVSNVNTFKKKFIENKYLLLLIAPVIIYFLIFSYLPMVGLLTAFKDYSPYIGIWNSPWVGFKYFEQFFNSFYFWRLIRNTFMINFYNLIFGFPAPIILALLINEVKNKYFKRTVQTITYMPHFIAIVVVVGILFDFLSPDYGMINRIIHYFGGHSIQFAADPRWFRTLYVGSGIWQGVGWGSIIYLAAIDGVDPQIYEAAEIDGANRFQKMIYVTIPSISNTIIILLILQIGNMLNVGFDKIILMYSGSNMETADVISTYVYRMGLLAGNYSYGTAVGLFNSVVNFSFLFLANKLARKYSEFGLW